MDHEDGVFMKRFSLLIIGMMVFTLVIIFYALYLHGQLVPSENPIREEVKLARIQPSAGVYAGETGRAEVAAAAAQTSALPAAYGGRMDPQEIYNNVCAACHTTGAAGSPVLNDASLWTDRLAQGIDALVSNAVNGINLMPAKGGRVDLTDDQVRVTVEWMVAQVQQ